MDRVMGYSQIHYSAARGAGQDMSHAEHSDENPYGGSIMLSVYLSVVRNPVTIQELLAAL